MRILKTLGKWVLLLIAGIFSSILLIHLEKITGLDSRMVLAVCGIVLIIGTVMLMIRSEVSRRRYKRQLKEIRETCMEMIRPYLDSEIICMPFGTVEIYLGKRLFGPYRECLNENRPCFAALTQGHICIVTMNFLLIPDTVAFFYERNEMRLYKMKTCRLLRQFVIVLGFPDIKVKLRLPFGLYGTDFIDQGEQAAQFMKRLGLKHV